MAEYWAEKVGRRTRDDDNGGWAMRIYEGIYTTSGIVPGAASTVKAVALPEKGFGYPGSSGRLQLRTIEKTQITSSGQWEAVLTYLPPTTGAWSSSNVPQALLPRSWSIGGELIQFADTGDWYYVNIGGDNDPIKGEVPAFKKIATGRLTIQEVISDIDAARTRAKAHVNTKNNAAFEGAAIGDMLYLGFEAEEFTANDGNTRWRLRHQFLERTIPGSSQGWERVLRDDTAQWSFIQLSPAADTPEPIYPSTSFSAIFSTS